jgi:hypothetical protein
MSNFLKKGVSMKLKFYLLYAVLFASIAPAHAFIFNNDCNAWGAQFQAGIRPIIWNQRGEFTTVNCLATPSLSCAGEIPKFSKLFHLPWQVGGQITYALSECTTLFTEANYAQAKGKNCFPSFASANLALTGKAKYKLVDWYFGVRYYFDMNSCWCMFENLSFFVGGKIGFVHHYNSSGLVLGSNNCGLVVTDLNATCPSGCLFGKNNVFAGGAQIGLNYCVCENWALVFTAEVVANCGPSTCCGVIPMGSTSTALLVDGVHSEIAFPITFGVKYNF